MKIAVTGATGHIGVNLCRALIAEGHQLRVEDPRAAICRRKVNRKRPDWGEWAVVRRKRRMSIRDLSLPLKSPASIWISAFEQGPRVIVCVLCTTRMPRRNSMPMG